MARPVGATIAYIIMFIASIWWLALGFLYFFGGFFWWYVGFPFAFLWGIIYGIAGLVGLGLAGGLAAGYSQAYSSTLLLAILFLIFSIPALLNGYGVGGAVLSAIVLVLLLVPSVRRFYTQ